MKKVKAKFGFKYSFDAKDHKAIKAALARRERQIDIAELFGVSVARLSQEIRQHGLDGDIEFMRGVDKNAPGAVSAKWPKKWPEEIVSYMRGRWDDGASASEISRELAAKFGYSASRNGVIGKLRRMDLLAGRRPPSPPRAIGGSAPDNAPDNTPEKPGDNSKRAAVSAVFEGDGRKRARVRNQITTQRGPNPTCFPAVSSDAPRLEATADDLLAAGQQPVGCRYIEGEVSASLSDDPMRGGWRYCQRATIDGSPYCAAHAARTSTSAAHWRRFVLTSRLPAEECAAAVLEKFGVAMTAASVRRLQRAARAYRGRAA